MPVESSDDDRVGLLTEFVETIRCVHTEAIVVAGSTVTGTATPFSDIDLAHVVGPDYTGPEKKFYYRGTQLISVNARTLEWWTLATQRPERAIFTVPAIRSAHILFDPDGTFARYRAGLATFTWAPLQAAADAFAGATLAAQAETVHKILSGLVRNEGMFEPASVLTMDLTLAMAVWHGVFVESSAAYHRQVREAMGDHSLWSNWHRIATGEDGADGSAVATRARAQAAIRLHGETFRQLEPVMTPDRRELAAATVAAVVLARKLL